MNDGQTTSVVHTCEEVRQAVIEAQRTGLRVGLVPTMGALHEGHLSLVRASRAADDFTAATIFVNPTQFGPGEDLDEYPRPFEDDLRHLERLGVALVFAPSKEEMYPADCSTAVEPPRVAQLLEGVGRPGHFRGVATIVLKLFQALPADVAYFGQKDFQQALVIRHMARDLKLPIKIQVCPTVREPDGLAMSSRNVYLTSQERERALSISRSLRRAQALFAEGRRSADALLEEMRGVLRAGGVTDIDYIALADAETLENVTEVQPGDVGLIAARIGATRLIDNLIME